ncbi:transcriptional regulator [Altererythrobacter sp. B11]|uniref:transcriptional regulator n=1 Tax=Altererythrobacter sp. B11 TaxID=2060312 RepID=UPI000DC7188F|nr:transcriptional regulator [Altererythrobacter sp. B11]BBC73912.1 transcriptional regulator [Altererythrobacter sp. B11]
MIVFLDFEASSLSERSYPIEVGWAFAEGGGENHLIRPAPGWEEWDPAAEAIHHIPRDELLERGTPHDAVARRMVEVLSGHDLYASAPSWDGKWLSALLRAGGFTRRTLRLRDTDELREQSVRQILQPVIPPESLEKVVESVITLADVRDRGGPPAHRALADAEEERRRWRDACDAARDAARRWSP